MKRTQLFSTVSKDAPKEEESRNAQLLIQAGFIHKEMAGVYAFLPLGWRVMQKIMNIVREEMNATGASELRMTTLQPRETWEKTDRWDNDIVDVWFKTQLQNGSEIGLAWSHEEPITQMMTNHISSYRNLPATVYQFQNKMRNEVRAKSGIMRTREFIMKDLYSYSRTDEEHQAYYDQVTEAYHRIFERAGIGEKTFFTFASGGAFTQFSHEFQTIVEAGEDTIYVSREKNLAVNEEVYTDDVLAQLGLQKDELEQVRAAEVGNIFSFGTTKSEEMNLYYNNEDGQRTPVVLGSYGIGIGRLMGVVTELMADDNGLVWPEAIAPFTAQIITIGSDEAVMNESERLYGALNEAGVETLWDDRDLSPGAKFAEHDMMGIPYRIVVSKKTMEAGEFELQHRVNGEAQMVSESALMDALTA